MDKLKIAHLENDIKEIDEIYRLGYVYRCWHYYTGETSKELYRQASAKTMKATYLAYHTLDTEMAIDRLKETYREKHLK